MFSGLHDLMLADHALMRATPDLQNTGTHIILSPSFKGGVRYMRQQYYDSMAIVRQFGKPDLFITVTTNPNWPEIKGNLLPGQTASDRPDIVSRVLKTKLKAILDDITKKKGFGDTEAFVYVIEFQKRGLPHAHILVILKGESKPKTSADYDKFVCAELPDREAHPELFETVSSCMIHGPCGKGINSPCTGEDGKCSKRFPKAFVDETGVDGDGYPVYRRRHPGPVKSASSQGSRLPTTVRFVSKRVQTPMARGRRSRREAVVVDNRWVVPYNPYLCQKYNCHVNVEICSTVQSVKYLYKYVYKGQDRATVTLRPHQQDTSISSENDGGADRDSIDEIQQYLDGRYLSPPEACWTIFKYDMQEKSHHVHQLPVHEEGKQLVHYSTTAAIQDIIEYNQFTKLTAFFELCGMDSTEGSIARELLYHEVPIYFVWKKRGNRYHWSKRSRGGDKAIGRMISVSPRDVNRYYLRILLCYRRGPTSFKNPRTVDGVIHETYKDTALAMGLLESDEENDRCLAEATTFQMPQQLRHLFAVLLVYCAPASPETLWNKHLPALSEDLLRREIHAHNELARISQQHERILNPNSVEKSSRVYRRAIYLTLLDINNHLISNGQSLTMYMESIPQFSDFADVETELDITERNRNRLIEDETSYDPIVLDRQAAGYSTLNTDQLQVFKKIMEAVTPVESHPSTPHLSGKQFFIDGPGGTGKSFLLEIILASVRRTGRIALAVAGSGIAAQLLTGGRTAHSTFSLPLDPNETSTCNFEVRSSQADLLKQTSLIVWDEAPMTHRYQYEAVDRTLKDLLKNDLPFGGITMVLSGDFRQTLPVIPRAGPAEIISASIKRSVLWSNFECLRLSINMRVHTSRNPITARAAQAFSDYLLRIGDGRHETSSDLGTDYIKIPLDILLDVSALTGSAESRHNEGPSITDKLSLLIGKVYSDFNEGNQPDKYFADRIILTPKNSDVLCINEKILEKLPGQSTVYQSVDSLDGDDELQRQEHSDLYPPELLNTISLSGMPPHKLKLKVGTPVMLIRNLNTKEGLCNGTRLRIIELRPNCMKAAIMTGAFAGKEVVIPRVTLISKNSGFPFELRRKQFPVQVAFAMTIN